MTTILIIVLIIQMKIREFYLTLLENFCKLTVKVTVELRINVYFNGAFPRKFTVKPTGNFNSVICIYTIYTINSVLWWLTKALLQFHRWDTNFAISKQINQRQGFESLNIKYKHEFLWKILNMMKIYKRTCFSEHPSEQ